MRADVYLFQPTNPPVETHLLGLLFLADACRRAGAARLTTVGPHKPWWFKRPERENVVWQGADAEGNVA